MSRHVYVIMPAGSDPRSPKKRAVIGTFCDARGLTAHFPMDRYHASGVDFPISSTLEEMRSSVFVIADLSFMRPSCYYELGLAEAIGCDVLVVAETGTDIHQSAHRSEVRFYSSLADLASVLTTARSGAQPN